MASEMAMGAEDGPRTASEEISLSAVAKGTRVHIVVTGELDIATVPALRAFAAGAVTPGVTELIIDLSEVTFLDSSGVQFLLLASRGLAALGVAFSLLCPQSNRTVSLVLETLRIDSVMTVIRSPP